MHGPAAVNPVAGAPEDERFYVAWRLRHEASLRFGHDPDGAFSDEADELGFKR